MNSASSSAERPLDSSRTVAERLLPRLLFSTIVLAELAHVAVAIGEHRAPSIHDGFQYFTVQYYFLNNAVQSHEVAQWIPFMSQGTVATFWYAVQGSLLQNVLLQAGSLLRGVDLLSVYHLGLFVDEMVLLVGTWLLARRFFRPFTVFFVAVSVVGSSVWLAQPYWNFRLYYAIPLVLELGHRFLDRGAWRWAFLAANLLAVQAVGNLPYFMPLVSFVVFAYFSSYAAVNHGPVWERLRSLGWGWPAAAAIGLGATSFYVAYKCLTIGTDQLVAYNPGRNRDGSSDLANFLTYGGLTDLRKWIELLLNVSPWMDVTLYAGILLVPLLLCGLVVADRRRVHLVLVAATMLLFTLGTMVAVLTFNAWPGMQYFRHIGLVSPLVKVLFCFVAGIGFEWLFEPHPWRSTRALRTAAAVAALTLVGGGCLALWMAGSSSLPLTYVSALAIPGTDRPPHAYDLQIVAQRLRSSGTLALAGAVVVGLVPLMLELKSVKRSTRAGHAIVCTVLVFVAVDLYHFKFAYLFDHSEIIGPDARAVVRESSMPFPRRRERELAHVVTTNSRLQTTLTFNEMLRRRFQGQPSLGAEYWSNNAFWFTDEAGSTFRIDSWLKPLDELLRMYSGTSIDDTGTPPPGYEFDALHFPLGHVAAGKVTGVDEDKIRFFVRAHRVAALEALVPLMSDPSYAGDLLFVLPNEGSDSEAASVPWSASQPLSTDDSRQLSYRVERFDANNLVIDVFNPESTRMWMSYADVWHPSWRATLNGRSTPVYRANMAYKAVLMEPGRNLVHFYFGSKLFSSLSAILSANAAFWLCALAWMISRLFSEGRPSEPGLFRFSKPLLAKQFGV